MKDAWLYRLWAGWFIVCALLGFIPQAEGFGRALLVLCALAFFVPGGVLLYRGAKEKDAGKLRLIRNLALIWLGSTLLLLVLNFLSVRIGDAAGQSLYGLLVLLSSPMVCGQYWILSLFGWAVLLSTSCSLLRNLRRSQR